MNLSDRLDSVPQLPQDYGNHCFYGGIGTLVIAVALLSVLTLLPAMQMATALMAALTIVKKVGDYYIKQETVRMCVLKTLTTLVWPVSILVFVRFL